MRDNYTPRKEFPVKSLGKVLVESMGYHDGKNEYGIMFPNGEVRVILGTNADVTFIIKQWAKAKVGKREIGVTEIHWCGGISHGCRHDSVKVQGQRKPTENK